MPSKVWVSGYLGLRYWVPQSRIKMRQIMEYGKPRAKPYLRHEPANPRHPAFPVEELSKYLAEGKKEEKE